MRTTERPEVLQASRKVETPREQSEYDSYYAIIRKIPRGRVLTYGDVACLVGRPKSARRVGYALFAARGEAVPWWRVINARGEISLRHHNGPGGPEDEQRLRLMREGISLEEDGRIDLDHYRYRPRPRLKAEEL